MPYYVAVVEDAGSDSAVGIWFPDLPGCFAAGDTIDEAVRNAGDAVALYAETLAKDGRLLPPPRAVADLHHDTVLADDIRGHRLTLIPASTAHDGRK